MYIFEYVVIFLFGAAMGSTANAIIDRMPRNESWFSGRSKCDKCKHVLSWKDLLPIFSFLWLQGKCRYCQSPIPYRNLVIEILLGLSFVVINSHSLSFNSILLSMILMVTTIIAVMDWETKLVSEALVVVWAAMVLVLNSPFGSPSLVKEGVGGVLVGVGLIGGIWAVSRGKAMGFGDVEIAVVMGWWLGWPKISVGLWAAFVTGAVVALGYVAKRKLKMKSTIAFGPFLVLGSWAAYWWGDKIIRWLTF